MAVNSSIAWTDDTANPITVQGGGWYCTRVSPGCANCYAEAINVSGRFGGNGLAYRHQPTQPVLDLKRDMLTGWARKTKPRRIFVSSMTDVFGEFIPDSWIFEILDAMLAAPLQTFIVLTKRNKRTRQFVDAWCEIRGLDTLPPNIWLIFSVEDQKRAGQRIPELLDTRAIITGLSIEPMLESIDLTPWLWESAGPDWAGKNPSSLSWIIIGGESGPKARPFYLEWARSLIEQCRDSGVPVFMKQTGQNAWYQGRPFRTRERKGENPIEWPEWMQIREFPQIGDQRWN